MAPQVVLHVVMAIAWVVLTDDFRLGNFLVGFVVGGAALWFYHGARGRFFYLRKVKSVVVLVAVLLWEQVKSNVQVAAIVLRPYMSIRPGIVTVPLGDLTDGEIAAVANLITLTPGTLSVDLSEDNKSLFVHVIDIEDEASVPQSLIESKELFERLVLEVSRR